MTEFLKQLQQTSPELLEKGFKFVKDLPRKHLGMILIALLSFIPENE